MNDIRAALDNPSPAPVLAEEGSTVSDTGEHGRPGFPPGGPVKALGITSDISGSQRCFYLNFNGQLVGLEANNRHGKLGLIALYGPASDFLEANWPQWSKPVREQDPQSKQWVVVKESEIVGFDQAEAARCHIEECIRQGVFDPAGRMRGRGAHRLRDGRGLVYHAGDKVLASVLRPDGSIKSWTWIDPGLFERYVYQAGEAIPRPWHESPGEGAAVQVLALLRRWAWKRELLDPRFVLGAIGASMLGGALPWRPHLWITGDRGTGKSTLNGKMGLVHRLLGEGLYRTSDTSAAGIRQSLRNATVPVMIDEREAEKDNRRNEELIALARVASSGDVMTRGSSDHTAQEFTLQSCFWFSSILIPPLLPQDRSRLAICELEPLPQDAEKMDLEAVNLPELGRKLFRRMVDGWPRLAATKGRFHDALQAVGHDSRACDQFGTLLACADVLLNDHDTADGLPDDEEVAMWATRCRPHRMTEISDQVPDWQACANHIVTTIVQARGGDDREMLGTWIGDSVEYVVRPLLTEDGGARAEKAAKRLQQQGLKLVHAKWHPEAMVDGKLRPGRWGAAGYDDKGLPGFVAVAREHQELHRHFKDTVWQGGVWYQSLKRTPHAIEGVKVKFAHASLNAVLVPLYAVLDAEELPEACTPGALGKWMAETKGAEA